MTMLPSSLANSARSYMPFHVSRGDVEVVPLDLSGFGHRLVDGLHRRQVPITPAHEGLAVDVLVILGEIQASAKRFVHHATVVSGGQAELRFGGRAEQGTPILVEVFPLHDDAVGRALECVHVVKRDAHVLEPQRAKGLESEHVANDRRGEIRDRPLLEEIELVRDQRDVLTGRARNRIHLVGLGLVVLIGGEPVGPHHRPRGSRGLAGDGGRSLLRWHALLWRDSKCAQDVAVLGHVVRLPVAHLRIWNDSGGPAVRCRIPRRCFDRGHR